ncbi:hypothetical protein ACQKOH_16900 [Sphingomonas sp. NPDC092331]|jgi:hypothetical protein|uniref:hypothetical protein n=1 Tax=unclassified Sphingomonas TaxID=196159 RepID=UPI0031F4A806
MLNLDREQPAGQIFGRQQHWSCGRAKVLVSFSDDEDRCAVFISNAPDGSGEGLLFTELGLSERPGFTLEPSIDCFAIGCPVNALDDLLSRLAARLA